MELIRIITFIVAVGFAAALPAPIANAETNSDLQEFSTDLAG